MVAGLAAVWVALLLGLLVPHRSRRQEPTGSRTTSLLVLTLALTFVTVLQTLGAEVLFASWLAADFSCPIRILESRADGDSECSRSSSKPL